MTDEHGAEGCYAGSVSDDPSRREPPSAPIIEELRARLVADVESEVRATRSYLGKERPDARGIAALGKVPRHRFVPPEVAHRAYENVPLPIGHGQTISQPYIVAVMTDLLETQPTDTVLEIGTGCGYQAAVLATLVKQVYSIEYVPELAEAAAARLAELGYANVAVRAGNGNEGWPEAAPFDGIIVTAAGPRIPERLLEQLKPGRKLVIPVGARGEQDLIVAERRPLPEGGAETVSRIVLPVAFVPLIGG